MNCQFCDSEISPNAVICPSCGSRKYKTPTFFRAFFNTIVATIASFFVYQFFFKNILEIYGFTVLTAVAVLVITFAYYYDKEGYWIKKGYYFDFFRIVIMVAMCIQLIFTMTNYSVFVKMFNRFVEEEQIIQK